jgi:hypothetical protein
MLNKSCILLLSLISHLSCYAQSDRIKGTVFLDSNNNGVFDKSEKGLKGICLSNGREVVQTSSSGAWELPGSIETGIFLIKPANYSLPVNRDMIPRHYPATWTGTEISDSRTLNFPLQKSVENEKFSALFFGDTQARGLKEVNYIFHDVVEECMGTDAVFGVSLGDIVADDPGLFGKISQGIGQIGIPWYNTFGNHDSDRDAKTNEERDNTFNHFFGPSTYAYEYGQVVFIDLNNIFFKGDGKSISHFTDDQLAFVKNYLAKVPADKLIVLMMHAPVIICDNREKLFELIQDRDYTFSISGHAHEQMNFFVSRDQGWKGKSPHHHLVNGTVCGSWWCGTTDEVGIPHATMNDGAPNGYSVITFDGNKYSVRYKAARRPENYQMNIYLPEEIVADETKPTKLLVNVFAGSERSVVEMQLDNKDDWIMLDKVDHADPEVFRMHLLSPYLLKVADGKLLEDVFGNAMDKPSVSRHMWETNLPGGMTPGTHRVKVRTIDMYGQSWQSVRIFTVR